MQGRAVNGSISREDAATVCVRALDAPPQQALVFEVMLRGWPCMFYGRLDPYSCYLNCCFCVFLISNAYIRIILLSLTSICFIESLGFCSLNIIPIWLQVVNGTQKIADWTEVFSSLEEEGTWENPNFTRVQPCCSEIMSFFSTT